MAIVTTDNKHYYDIADAIREKKNVDTKMTPAEMASAIASIPVINTQIITGEYRVISEGS